jgi:hypothetical protein
MIILLRVNIAAAARCEEHIAFARHHLCIEISAKLNADFSRALQTLKLERRPDGAGIRSDELFQISDHDCGV